MIHRLNALFTTEKLREIPQSDVQDFPHIAIEADLEDYANRCSSWHWHEYFEFAVVSGGALELSIQNRTLHIADGEGYFLNSNVLHLCRVAAGSAHCRLQVHQFDGRLIASSAAVERRYVQPLEGCAALAAVHLKGENPEHACLLKHLRAAFACAEAEQEGYEMAVSSHLLQAWQVLYGNVRPLLSDGAAVSTTETGRIKLMLACIHTRYGENLSISTVAQAANICTREAYRCFRRVLGTTPTRYLMHHRVNAAARMLHDGGASITGIASACGFSSPSYFCKVFKEILGVSPREFRRREA